jgi:hypothetical protein
VKLLIGEIKGGKSRGKGNLSSRHKRSSSKESRFSNEDSRRTNDYIENSLDESTANKTAEDPSKGDEAEEDKEKVSSTEKTDQEEKEIEKAIEPIKSTFEVLAVDSNTERKFLENITFNQPDHLSDVELKSTVFNSYKTIETLQQDLM